MIKKNRLLIASLINVIIYITIILVPKDELAYKLFFLVFILCIIIVPVVLTTLSYLPFHKGQDKTKKNIIIQVLNLAVLTLITTQIFFANSLVEEKRLFLRMSSIGISFILFGLSFTLMYIKLSKRKIIILLVLSFIVYFAYLYYCVDLSFQYSISW